MGLLILLNQKESDIALLEAKCVFSKCVSERASPKPTSIKSQSNKTVSPVTHDGMHDGMVYFENARIGKDLGLTQRVTRVIAITSPGNLKATLSTIKWSSIIKPYRVTLINKSKSKISETELANVIWHSMKEPRVSLDDPKTIIDVIVTDTKAYIGTNVWINDERFQDRRAHKFAMPHPTTVHPSITRALLNMAQAKRIHDPFCGSGGFLIEAGLMGKRISGADIDHDMVVRAKANCAALRLKPEIRIADATLWLPRCQAIVTDLPYGRNTKPVAIQHLVEAFLHRAAQSTKRVVIGAPSELRFPKPWKIVGHASSYVHRSMTRHFYVLEKVIS